MAKNLRSKIPAGDTLIIRDIDSDVMKKFVDEVGASSKEGLNVEVAGNAREVAEKSVCCHFFPCAGILISSDNHFFCVYRKSSSPVFPNRAMSRTSSTAS